MFDSNRVLAGGSNHAASKRAVPIVRNAAPLHPLMHSPPVPSVVLTLRSAKAADSPSMDAQAREGEAMAERVRQACAGRSVAEVARLTRFHPETVRRHLRGQAPSAEFLAALVRRLGLSPLWLLCGEGEAGGALPPVERAGSGGAGASGLSASAS